MDQNRGGLPKVNPQGPRFNFAHQNIYGSQYVVNSQGPKFNFAHQNIYGSQYIVNSQGPKFNFAHQNIHGSEYVIVTGNRGNHQLAGEHRAHKLSEEQAKTFVEHYYTTLDGNRGDLANFYQEGSMLNYEGQIIQGSRNIIAKLTSLPFQQCHHSITTIDCQHSGVHGGMLVFVSGNYQLAGGHHNHTLKFSQMFHLIPTPQGSCYVLNDIFRLEA